MGKLGKLNLFILVLECIIISIIRSEKAVNLKDLRSNPVNMNAANDMIKVELGISEQSPNTRIAFYIDVNNDKLYNKLLKLVLIS